MLWCVAEDTPLSAEHRNLKAEELDAKKCDRTHEHVHLLDGKAAAAQVYPPALCECIVKGISRQLRDDVKSLREGVNSIEALVQNEEATAPVFNLELLEDDDFDTEAIGSIMMKEVNGLEGDTACDDVKGGELDPGLVRAARLTELRYLWEREVYQ